VISNLDGTLRHIWRYENGTSIRTVNLVPLTPEEAEKWQGTRIKTMGKAPKSAFTRSLDSEADPFLPPIPGGDDKGGQDGDDFGLDDGNGKRDGNRSANDVKSELTNTISDPALKSLIDSPSIPVRESTNYPHLHLAGSIQSNGIIVIPNLEVIVNPDYFDSLSPESQDQALAHEYFHADRIMNGHQDGRSHEGMMNDPRYEQMIRDTHPGASEEVINALKYDGCADELRKLPPEEQERINEIINEYGRKH
jgi:hypothetical protein